MMTQARQVEALLFFCGVWGTYIPRQKDPVGVFLVTVLTVPPKDPDQREENAAAHRNVFVSCSLRGWW